MDFYAILDQVVDLLRQRQRVTYRALQRQFQLDDACMADLKAELIEAQHLALDEAGTVLVWTAETVPPLTAASGRVETSAQAPLVYTPPYLAEKILHSRQALAGERKHVTVLFADVKDSMELLADRDPEEARQLLDPVLELMMEAVHRFEGTVNQVMGDGIMALFGAPIAHEDHAVRACYAALRMQDTVKQYAASVQQHRGITIHMRVGLNAGEVVVRAISNDLHMDYTAVGQTTHMAARMEQMAMPGTILITQAVLALVDGYVHTRALGPVPIKGLSEPAAVFELLGVTPLRRRFQVTAMRGLTHFVGRHLELEVLAGMLEHTVTGGGHLVAIVGEAGVGKSRLVYELLHSPRAQRWSVLESAAMSYSKATPYFPMIDLLKRYCHIEEHDDTRTIRAKVTGRVLTLDPTFEDAVPALLSLLDALPDNDPFRALEPRQRQQRTLAALKNLLLREAQTQPLLLVFEDLHWVDTETQALLDSLVESLPTVCLLLLVNYRPEYQHGWDSKAYYTSLRLDPLPPVNADELLQILLGGEPDLQPLKQLLITRTEGNPFFLEESVRTLVETGVLSGVKGAYRPTRGVTTIQVPETVQAVLAARIDRLPPEARHLLQTAAVVGSEVPFPLLRAVAELPEAALHRCLEHLQAVELLYETHLFPERVYTFKHALTHQVTYEGLLHERRRALHTRILGVIETLYANRLIEQSDQLAYHAVRGAVWDKALAYCRQAGARAAMRSAHRGAAAYWEEALVALQHLPTTEDTLTQAIDVRFDLRNALWPLGDHKRIFTYLRQAESLAETLGDQRRLALLASFMTQHFRLMDDPEQAIASGQRALAIAASLGDSMLQVETNFRLGRTYDSVGDYRQAAVFFRRNIVLLADRPLSERFGLPGFPAVLSRAWLALCLAELGEFSEGIARGEEAVQMAQAAQHPYSLASAYCGLGGLYLTKGDMTQALGALERGLALCQTWDFRVLFPVTAAHLGYAYALCGRLPEAISLLEQAVAQAAITEPPSYYDLFLVRLSEVYLMAGRLEHARALLGRALAPSHHYAERGGHRAWALRLLGEFTMYGDPSASPEAESAYRQALVLAEGIGMRPLVAHCHLGLSALYHRWQDRVRAHTEWSMAVEQLQALEMPFWLSRATLPHQGTEAKPLRQGEYA